MEQRIVDAAKNVSCHNPRNTVFGAKRLGSRRVDDPDDKDTKRWPFTLADRFGYLVIEVTHKGEKRQFNWLSAMGPRKIKETTEA
ncbi:hypothetical protein FRB90_004555 [Tulasnella sp. 427]|nr:hypothetical protein FRB90_004555 [Tulasnella sp. 427]